MGRGATYLKNHKLTWWILFLSLIYIVLIVKLATITAIDNSWFFGIYSVLVSAYILSRFLLAHFYNPVIEFDPSYQPSVTFITPAKNEGDNIAQTLRALLAIDYPKELFEVFTVNDGSTDDTLSEMLKVKAEAKEQGIAMTVINWPENRGKRPAMAEGIIASRSEIICFVDSDSFVEPSAIKELVKYFRDTSVGAVAGHADVYNKNANWLTKTQAIRYFVAFKAYKAADALFGTVICCSGCCSAYRREYVLEVLDSWVNQKFMGAQCTYGDDRSLTNYIIRKYRAFYSPTARSQTVVPENWSQYIRQQLRWKKSWTRESARACLIMWKKNPILALSFYVGVFLPLMAPAVVVRSLLWFPTSYGVMPWVYILGLILMSSLFSLYYFVHTKDKIALYGGLLIGLYYVALIWQVPYAILTVRDGRWGTR